MQQHHEESENGTGWNKISEIYIYICHQRTQIQNTKNQPLQTYNERTTQAKSGQRP